MCGIAGIALRPSAPRLDLAPRLGAMAQAMAHRGPDDSGVYVTEDGRAGLANVRLAIRDRSPAGRMPMGSGDGLSWISYNGECYNPEELRAPLEAAGYRLRSSSDTELILYAHRLWGEAAPQRLRGMFAYALLDSARGATRLLLVRDQLGVKPLFVAETPQALVFASELRALLASGLVERAIEPQALAAYLLLGSVPAPLTIFRDVRALEPGCALSLRLDGAEPPHRWRFWALPRVAPRAVARDEAVAEVRAALEQAVCAQLVSDVPLGAFLSGGLDSSAVVALMRRASSGAIRTCSLSFEEQAFSEAPFARALAEAVGTEHHERVLSGPEVLGALPRVLPALDQPSADGVNSYFVAETARQAGLTVALSGLGGDELFGGYPNTFGGVPRTLRALRAAQALPAGAALASAGVAVLPVAQRWAKVAVGLGRAASPASAYLVQRGLFTPGEARALLPAELWGEAGRFDPVRGIADGAGEPEPGDGLFAWVSRAELRAYTLNQLLRDTDVMSMAHGLEVRVPLLDQRLAELALGLPAAVKRAGVGPKPLLAAAVGDLLPPLVRERRDKRGFTLPFERWLRGPLLPQLNALAAEPRLLRPGALAAARRGFETGRLHWSRLWALVALEGWAASWIKR
jgi:asparagine synthase (glutamine-hydrolysing)